MVGIKTKVDELNFKPWKNFYTLKQNVVIH